MSAFHTCKLPGGRSTARWLQVINCTRVVVYDFVSLMNIVESSTEIYIGLASRRWAQPGLSVTQRWHTRTPPLHRAAEGFLAAYTLQYMHRHSRHTSGDLSTPLLKAQLQIEQ
jgi:hypothetical protein